MKVLRDAWEKFTRERKRQERRKAVTVTGVRPPSPETPRDIITEVREGGKAGWKAPIYEHSRSIHLDPQVLTDNRSIAFTPNSPEADAYKVLRTRILHRTREQGGNTIMITSTLPKEGKTLTAVNLSLTFAKEFKQTVLLVDADFRQQSVHKVLGVQSDKGLIDYLVDERPISELITWPGIDKFTFISGGRPVFDSTELLGSPLMKELVADMKNRYPDRYVFFDVPPILVGADTLAFAPLVDFILVVVQAGRTPKPELMRAIDMLPREKILGIVMNRQTKIEKNSYYYGYYGYGSKLSD